MAYNRIKDPDSYTINADIMLITSIAALLMSCVRLKVLHSDMGGAVTMKAHECSYGHCPGSLSQEPEHSRGGNSNDSQSKETSPPESPDKMSVKVPKQTNNEVIDQETAATGKKENDENVEKNLNIQAAIIDIIGDCIQCVGVIVAATIIKLWPEWKIVDPICTFTFSIVVMFTTYPILKRCFKVIMETTPDDIDTEELYK